MDILQFPHPILLTPTVAVTYFDEELTHLLEEMYDTMKRNGGMGLAANQVGLNLSAFVMTGLNEERVFMVNPVIVGFSQVMANLKEGCLSAPDEFLTIISRAEWVVVQFQDETGKPRKRLFTGIHSVCVQHEMEHLYGKAFLDSDTLPASKRKAYKKKWGLE